MKILLVDDDTLFLDGMRYVLRKFKSVEIVVLSSSEQNNDIANSSISA